MKTELRLINNKQIRNGLAVLAVLAVLLTSSSLTGCSPPEITLTEQQAAGQQTANQLCAGCHGTRGIGTLAVNPNLACQKEGYLAKQLRDYRSGARNNHKPMVNIAKMLKEEDIDSLASWYAMLPCDGT